MLIIDELFPLGFVSRIKKSRKDEVVNDNYYLSTLLGASERTML